MKKAIFYLILLCLVGGGGYAGYEYYGKNHQAAGVHFKTATVQTRDMQKTILATGTVKPMVGAKVKVGARVEQGDLIAIVEQMI